MLIYEVYSNNENFIGNLYVDNILQIEEKNNTLFNVINKILKNGIDTFTDGIHRGDTIGDEGKKIYKIKENTFWILENELINLGYILQEAPVKEV